MSTPVTEPGGRRSADRSARLWALFDQAADLPPAEQQALLEAACADDPGLRAEVERLLADDARLGAAEGSAFLKTPVIRSTGEPPVDAAPSDPASEPPPPSQPSQGLPDELTRLLAPPE